MLQNMASDGKISNIWDKSPENFSTISSPTLKNVQPYKYFQFSQLESH